MILVESYQPPTLLGLLLSTHRARDVGPDAASYFQFETAIAALSIGFFRTTVGINPEEPWYVRWTFAALLAALAYQKRPYPLIAAIEIFSYAVPYLLYPPRRRRRKPDSTSVTQDNQATKNEQSTWGWSRAGTIVAYGVGSAVCSLLVAHLAASGRLSRLLGLVTPPFVVRFLKYMFPIEELVQAYHIMSKFAHPVVLQKQVSHLLFVTFHIQVGMGYLGIDFLRQEQGRRNELVRMDVAPTQQEEEADSERRQRNDDDNNNNSNSNGSSSADGHNGAAAEKPRTGGGAQSTWTSRGPGAREVVEAVRMDRARRFQRTAPAFIVWTALPYMFQIILYGNVNKFAFTCVQHDLHRAVRLNELFDHDNRLMSMATDSATSPEAYATSMGKVLDISYEIWNRKLFSLPKILLLPAVMSRQPMLVVQVFPVIVASDWIKAAVMSAMTRKVEHLEKELQDLRAVRSKVESFDIKNAELLQRSGIGATRFTQRRWEDLTVKVQARIVVSDLINRSKLFFSFIQRNFIFSVLIDCALANLIAIGKIVSADTFVFSRAIEDTVDMLLMRSRAEAELARMKTEIEKLDQLAETWERSKNRNLLRCHLDDPSLSPVTVTSPSLLQHRKNTVVLRNLVYSRGTAHVRADHIELDAGVYALTGSNGSGKSTLFRILMSCHTNERPIDLPASINLLTPMEPLCEEDDFRRETTCEVDDTDEVSDSDDATSPKMVESVEIGASGEVTRSLVESPQESTSPVPHPRLAISMPSKHVVEISQNFYWPLYARPIDWIYQEERLDELSADQLDRKARRVAEELRSLEFFQTAVLSSDNEPDANIVVDPEEAMIQKIVSELLQTKEDWFSDLSGGQKSKVELVRKVFLHERCPDVLLIDETMAPLDPTSKALVMGKIKDFCSRSVVIVIYHTDVGRETTAEGGASVECVPSNSFFSKNIHLEAGVVHVRGVC